jgi:hypothetical protein
MSAATVAVCLMLAGCRHADAAEALPSTEKVVTLTMPKPLADGDQAIARVVIGSLPRRTRLTIRLPDGTTAGTILPYGRNAERGGAYTIPIPSIAVVSDTVTLHIELREPGGAKRAPTDRELEKVEISVQSRK